MLRGKWESLKNHFLELYLFSSIVTKTFSILRRYISLLPTTIPSSKRAFYQIRTLKELKMPDVRNANQEKSWCVICLAECHVSTAIQQRAFRKYCEVASSTGIINLLYQSYKARESHFQRCENRRPTIDVEKKNWIKEMVKGSSRCPL